MESIIMISITVSAITSLLRMIKSESVKMKSKDIKIDAEELIMMALMDGPLKFLSREKMMKIIAKNIITEYVNNVNALNGFFPILDEIMAPINNADDT
jgi:uncharacterized membrane protein